MQTKKMWYTVHPKQHYTVGFLEKLQDSFWKLLKATQINNTLWLVELQVYQEDIFWVIYSSSVCAITLSDGGIINCDALTVYHIPLLLGTVPV